MAVASLTQPITADRIDDVVQRIVDAVEPDRIILFGSHATNSARADSDLDLLVVMPESTDVALMRGQAFSKIYKSLRGLLFAIDVLVYTATELEERRGRYGLLVADALEYGRTLYERK